MKKIIAMLVLVGSTVVGFSQGTVNFANGAAGVNAPIQTAAGPNASTGYVADLYYGADAGSLTALGANVAFGTGGNAGYFFGGTRTLDGFAAGSTVTVQVRAWNLADGATYETALGAGESGFSNIFTVTLGGGAIPTPSLVGLQSFQMTVVPEPSTFALGALGIGALLMVRRRKA